MFCLSNVVIGQPEGTEHDTESQKDHGDVEDSNNTAGKHDVIV